MLKKPKVSIIIVHYKAKKELFECLESIKKSRQSVWFEVIVVDNDEVQLIERELKKRFSWIKYIKAAGNIGFGAGNNLGAAKASGGYLFFLNPDTKVLPGSIHKLVTFLKNNKKAGIVAPLLLDPKGDPYPFQGSGELTPISGAVALSGLNKLFPNNPISKKYWLIEWNKKKVKEVFAVPGTAFMIRKSIFEAICGFDEHFFLYFEESDLCKRIRELGLKVFIVPQARVVHIWGVSTKKMDQELNKKFFTQSRFWYFRKHYGWLNAVFVHFVTEFNKIHIAVLGILLLAAFLRFWKINTLMMFIGDFGWFYLSARDMLLTGQVPLVGIPSSVPAFHQGAIFTWMLGFALLIGKFHPVSGAVMTGILGVIGVWLTYKIVSILWSKQVALIASLLVATSPLVVIHTRMPYDTAPIFPLTLLIAWSTQKIVAESKFHWLLLGLWLALLYQFELAALILLPVVLLALFWQKVAVTRSDLVNFSLGLLFGLTPFILWDIKHGFLQILGFVAWMVVSGIEGGIRVIQGGFLGSEINDLTNYLVRLTLPQIPVLVAIFLILSPIYLFFNLKKANFGTKLILSWLLLPILAFAIRGNVAEAYMPLIFFPVLVSISLLFYAILERFRFLGLSAVALFAIVNSLFLLKNNFLLGEVYGPTIGERINASKFIVEEAKGRQYNLVGKGPGAQFPSFTMNYEYLAWWLGKPPSKNLEPLRFVVSEKSGKIEIKKLVISN